MYGLIQLSDLCVFVLTAKIHNSILKKYIFIEFSMMVVSHWSECFNRIIIRFKMFFKSLKYPFIMSFKYAHNCKKKTKTSHLYKFVFTWLRLFDFENWSNVRKIEKQICLTVFGNETSKPLEVWFHWMRHNCLRYGTTAGVFKTHKDYSGGCHSWNFLKIL